MNNDVMLQKYMVDVRSNLINSLGIRMPDDVMDNILNKYKNSDLSYKDLVEAVNNDVEDFLGEMVERDLDYSVETEQREEEEKAVEEMAKDETKRDIKINDSDINLMMIASANTPQELQDVINKIPNLNVNLKNGNLDNLEFNFVKNMVFEQYRDSIPEALRDIGNLELVTMEEYKNLAENINNDYDSITVDNGNGEVSNYDIDKDLDVEDYKNDRDIVNATEIEIKDDKDYVEPLDKDKYDKKTFDINKKVRKEEKKQAEMAAMMPQEATVIKQSPLERETHKVLKKEPPKDLNSEKGYTDTINIMLSIISFVTVFLLLLLYFIIN